MAVGKGFKIATAYVEINADDDAARKAVRDLPGTLGPDADRAGQKIGRTTGKGIGKGLGPEADRSGRESGGKLAKGMELGLVRNAPLIAAAVGAALAFGAPVALAGAQALFGTIGIVAAAQSVEVRSAWSDTWKHISADTVAASGPIQKVLIDLADNVSNRFDALQPQIARAFSDSAPLVDEFANSLLDMTENTLPGLFDALEHGQPVVAGLGDFLRSTGTGLSDFFSILSQHAPAAGKAFSALGDIMGDLLPILGELLGNGVELASIVLPPLARVLDVVADAVSYLGPLLPAISLGFAGMKIVQSATGWFDSFSKKLSDLPSKLTAMNLATAGVGIALVGAITAFQNATETGRQWAEMLREGGQAAEIARANMQDFGTAFASVNEGWSGVGYALTGMTGQFNATAVAMAEAEQSSRELWSSMSPLEQAQSKVAEWTQTLTYRLSEYGAGTAEVEAAQRRLDYWTGELASEQGNLESALHGVTMAMLDQADQALAAIDSNFAYRHATDQLEDAQANLAETIANRTNADQNLRTSEEDVQRAQLAVEEQTLRTAEAYARQQADLSGLTEGSAEYRNYVNQQLLGELYRLRDAAGPQMRAAIDQQIQALRNAGVTIDDVGNRANNTTGDLQNLGRQRPIPIATLRDAASGGLLGILNLLSRVDGYTATSNTYLNTFHTDIYRSTGAVRGTTAQAYLAEGGNVGDALKGFPRGGKISGPGSRTSDSILAMSPSGPLRVSDDEWVIPGDVSASQGDRRMAALVGGTADVVPKGENRRGSGPGIGELHVHIDGKFDFTTKGGLRKVAEALRDALVDLEREYR